VTVEFSIKSLISLATVFVGAWAAFELQNLRQEKQERKLHIAGANRALYTIYNMWNILLQYQKKIVDPYRGKSDAWLNMGASPSLETTYGLTSFKADQLVFLLQTEHVNVFSIVLLEEQRFLMLIRLIEDRSSILLNHVHPKLGDANVRVGEPLRGDKIELLIGIDKVHILKKLTSGIVENIDENIKSLKYAHDELRKAMKTLYPKVKFLKANFPE
jgi:hypothetical protein